MDRFDGRKPSEMRPVRITRGFLKYPDGSVLIEMGDTKVICTATVDEGRVPPFLKGTGKGWVTAEYSLLPGSTETRTLRDISKGRISGRSHEIQRLIGRSLRSVVDLEALGERTVWIDCDVIQADGGTRMASVTGGFVALYDALKTLVEAGAIDRFPIKEFLSGISVGIVGGEVLLDLNYREDSVAKVDMNVVMTESGSIVEIQGTGEGGSFGREELTKMLDLAEKGIKELIAKVKEVLEVDAG